MSEETSKDNDAISPTPLSEEALAQHDEEDAQLLSVSEKYLKLLEAHNKLHELHNGTNERLNSIELRLQKVEASSSGSSSLARSESSEEDDDYQLGFEENTIPEVLDMNFELFKNRYSDSDGKNCIEVLVAGSNLEEQVRQELGRRSELEDDDQKRLVNYDDDSDENIIHRIRIQSPAILWLLCKSLVDPHPNLEWKGQNRTTFYRPFAWFVYAHDQMKEELNKLEEYWSTRECASTYLTDETKNETVEETVHRIEQTLAAEATASETASVHTEPDQMPFPAYDPEQHKQKSLARRTDRDLLQKALLDNYHTLLELRCYTEFVEKRILPPSRRYEDPNKPEARSIRYQDLWFLFQPGELIVTQRETSPLSGGNDIHLNDVEIGRLRGRWKPDATSITRWNQPTYTICRSSKIRENPVKVFEIDYYVIDYNGAEFGRVNRFTLIHYFEGLQDVTSLAVYPLRFHPEREELRKRFEENGSKFNEAVQSKHMAYCGWSLPWLKPRPPPSGQGPPPVPGMPMVVPGRPPGARPYVPEPTEGAGVSTRRQQQQPVDPSDTIIRNSTYIESDVIIDVNEAVRASPDTVIDIVDNYHLGAPLMHACQDTIEIIRWSDRRRTEKLTVIQDRTQAADAVSRLELGSLLAADPYNKKLKSPTFTADDLLLLPNRIFGYALRERKFFQADLRFLRGLQTDIDSFDSLKIDPNHIRIVQAVVASHFQRKAMEELPEFMTMIDQDLIRGKGRGLVILLHGAPGVGKTATAEAVALWHKRPLFVITCGDLGFTPKDVESSLGEIFRLAHLWNCILLLDEADVFLSQRETSALERNALVSVFLRVLEYYNGILFLTTNRVGTLDEAFKSRVHLSLYYPPLGRTQTEEITRMNLVRLRTIEDQRAKSSGQKPLFIEENDICSFSTEHWDRHAVNDGAGRWNGRQIRNAVQIAASLAWYDRKTSKEPGAEDLPPILHARHFQTVEATMTLFEGYMTKTKGGTDKFIAGLRGERSDGFKSPSDATAREGHRSLAVGPDPAGGGGHGGYHRYQDTPRWPQQPMPNATGPSDLHATVSPHAGSSGQSYQSYQQPYQSHRAQTGPGGPPQQHGYLTPSPSLNMMHTDPRPHMMAPDGGIPPQTYSQTQMPPMSPQNSYTVSSGMASTPERRQGADYHAGPSAPRSLQQPLHDVFGSSGAEGSFVNPAGSSFSQAQPAAQHQQQWDTPPGAHGQGM